MASAITTALLGTAVFSGGAFAQQGPPPGVGEDEATNNLSVPAIFVPSVGVGTPTCTAGDDTVAPDPAEVSATFPGCWVQGEATWQADCVTAAVDTVSARAEWGDNLTSAPLKQRTPIRVEIGLLADPTLYPMGGFEVVKLTPELLDRLATYGTCDPDNMIPYEASLQDPYPEVRVWDAGATLSIIRDDGLVVLQDEPFGAEINSTGRVVYGFNWRKPVAGVYTITFYAPNVGITDADHGTVTDTDGDGRNDTVTLEVSVALSAGRGGSGGGGGGGGGSGGGGGGGGNPNR